MTQLQDLREDFRRRRSTEERVLLACSRQTLCDAARATVTEAATSVRWDVALEAAVRHQIAPLVFENLGACGIVDQIPADVQAGFHHATMRNMAAKAELATAMLAVVEEFRGRGFDVMLVKGTALDHRLFDEPWYTASADVDLLLRSRCAGALDDDARRRIVELNAQRPQVDVHADRHPDLVMNGVLPLDFAAIWADARPTEVGGQAAFLMRIEDELLAACINACRKRFFRLKSLCAVHEIVARHPEIDWHAFARRAIAWRCNRIAYAALVAASIGLGGALPAELRRLLGVSRPRAALLHSLLVRMGFGSLPTIHRHRRVMGKYLSRWLVLRYASLGWREAMRGTGVALRQMRRGAESGGRDQ